MRIGYTIFPGSFLEICWWLVVGKDLITWKKAAASRVGGSGFMYIKMRRAIPRQGSIALPGSWLCPRVLPVPAVCWAARWGLGLAESARSLVVQPWAFNDSVEKGPRVSIRSLSSLVFSASWERQSLWQKVQEMKIHSERSP